MGSALLSLMASVTVGATGLAMSRSLASCTNSSTRASGAGDEEHVGLGVARERHERVVARPAEDLAEGLEQVVDPGILELDHSGDAAGVDGLLVLDDVIDALFFDHPQAVHPQCGVDGLLEGDVAQVGGDHTGQVFTGDDVDLGLLGEQRDDVGQFHLPELDVDDLLQGVADEHRKRRGRNGRRGGSRGGFERRQRRHGFDNRCGGLDGGRSRGDCGCGFLIGCLADHLLHTFHYARTFAFGRRFGFGIGRGRIDVFGIHLFDRGLLNRREAGHRHTFKSEITG